MTHVNTVTASGTDNDGTAVSGQDSATVTIANVTPSITVSKSANPTSVSEAGGSVQYTVQIVNNSNAQDPVTVTSLSDNRFGNLNGQGNCTTPQTIQPGASYSCSFSRTISGNAGTTHVNTVTASGTDNDGTAVSGQGSATVTFTFEAPSITVSKSANPTSVPESGGTVQYTVQIVNTSNSQDPVTITSLSDNPFGNLNGQGNCVTPQTIQPGASYSCAFSKTISGNEGTSHINTVTASGTDNDGTAVSGNDDAAVTFTNAPPSIAVTKSADPTSIAAPGGDVEYTVQIENTSNAQDPVTINSLTDDKFGNLVTTGTCNAPGTIQPGNTYTCTFTKNIPGSAGGSHTNTVTASGVDNEGTAVGDSDSATVNFTEPLIEVTKIPSVTSAPSGASVEFTIIVRNNSSSRVTIQSLEDSVFGDVTSLPGSGCSVPWNINSGVARNCQFDGTVTANSGNNHVNTVTASGQTQSPVVLVSGQASATVAITGNAPETAGRAPDSPQDLVIITNDGARVRWVYNGQQGQAQSNAVSNPANYKKIYLPVMIIRLR